MILLILYLRSLFSVWIPTWERPGKRYIRWARGKDSRSTRRPKCGWLCWMQRKVLGWMVNERSWSRSFNF